MIPIHGGYFDKTYALAGNTVGRQPLNGGNGNGYDDGGASYTLTKTDVHAVAFHSQASSSQSMNPSEVCPTLDKSKMAAVAFKMRGGCEGGGNVPFVQDVAGTMKACKDSGGWSNSVDHAAAGYMQVTPQMQVRRLTPTECERLQGFPEGHTKIPKWNGWRKMDVGETPESCIAQGFSVKQNKKTGKWRVNDVDSVRYKALGNSMAVNVMQLLGERIAMVDAIADIKAVE